MAGRGQHGIVMAHAHVDHLGAGQFPHFSDEMMGDGGGFRQRGQDHSPPLEQGGERGFHAALFGAGDGMAGHEMGRNMAVNPLDIGHHAALGAPHVGHYRVGG